MRDLEKCVALALQAMATESQQSTKRPLNICDLRHLISELSGVRLSHHYDSEIKVILSRRQRLHDDLLIDPCSTLPAGWLPVDRRDITFKEPHS